MERIEIAVASDQKYSPGLRATVGSIAYFASRDVELDFHVLDGGIAEDSYREIEAQVRRLHPHVCFHRHAIADSLFRDFPAWSGSRMTYARLMLPDLLPDVSHVIYSDVDFLWLADVAELWRERDDGVVFQSVVDGCGRTVEAEAGWFAAHGLPFDSRRYVCCGLSFYNLDLFRKESIIPRVADFLKAHPDVRFVDQSALNALLGGRIRLLPRKWQTLTLDATAQDLTAPVVLHYGGEIPWQRFWWANLLTDSVLLWYRMTDVIRGVKAGTTLKNDFSWWQRLYKRGWAKMMLNPMARRIVYRLFQLMNRGGYCEDFEDHVHDLRLAKVFERFGI